MRNGKSMSGANMNYGRPRALSGTDKASAPKGGQVKVQKASSVMKKK